MNNKNKFNTLSICILMFFFTLVACGGEQETVEESPAVADVEAADQAGEPSSNQETEDQSSETMVEPDEPDGSTEEIEVEVMDESAHSSGIELETAQYYLYSNANELNDTVVFNGKQWGAGIGGVVAFDLATGEARKYTPLDGLPHGASDSIDICPSPDPALVVGTHEGLAIYDPSTDSFVSGDEIYDAEGRIFSLKCTETLLIAYDDGAGVNIYDADSGESLFYDKEAINWIAPRKIVVNGDDIWLIGDFTGSTVIRNGEPTIYNIENGAPSDIVNAVAFAPNGDLWIGAREGLFKITPDGQTTSWDKDNSEEISFSGPQLVEFAPDGTLWVALGSGLCQWDTDNGDCLTKYQNEEGMVPDAARHIDFDENGGIYIQTNYGGMSAFDGTTWTTFFLNDEYPTNMVKDVVEDEDGYIWTLNGALYRTDLDVSAWEKFDVFGDDMVVDPNGGIWVVSGPVLFYANATDEPTRYSSDEGMLDSFARTVEIDDDGRVWVGQEEGISIFDGDSFTLLDAAAGWPEGIVSNLMFNSDNDVMWASTTKGLIKIDTSSLAWDVIFDEDNKGGLSQPTFGKMATYQDGHLIAAIGGLFFFDGSTLTQFEGAECSVGELDVDNNDNVWITCFDGLFDFVGGELSERGVYVYSAADGDWQVITTKDGLPNSSVRGIMTDSSGAVWLVGGDTSGGGGILRIIPQ